MSCEVHKEASRWYAESRKNRATFERIAKPVEWLTGLLQIPGTPISGKLLTDIRQKYRDRSEIKIGELYNDCINMPNAEAAQLLFDAMKKAARF